MFSAVWPALLLQTLLLIALTVVYLDDSIEKDVIVFYVSIPWRAQQVVVLGVLAWVVRSRSFGAENGASTPLQAPLSTKESA
ncbi:hypothetical protein EXIGLDRAFT_768462 [Exidia glandulosa HHB12029]|uniref:Uncharacterized protein n=1 Tax=Exidia glandulosa HHB12029 TaxID=1314781 RepID=A0A165I7V7_EXIGL|nr:hypothetical protein EXIGLDRAFT_768462 [Exidia glandulosa HHB12029]